MNIITGPCREPSPCCWDGRCIHCRERAAERSTVRRRSQLSDVDRTALEIFPRPGQTFAARLRRLMIPVHPTQRAAHLKPRPALNNSVLPADFNVV